MRSGVSAETQINGVAEFHSRQLEAVRRFDIHMPSQVEQTLARHFVRKDGPDARDGNAFRLCEAAAILAFFIEDSSEAVVHMQVIPWHAAKTYRISNSFRRSSG